MPGRHPEERENEKDKNQWGNFLEKWFAFHSISLGNDQYSTEEPDKRSSKKEKNYWLSKKSDNPSLNFWHSFVLLFSKEDSLRKILTVKIAKVLVVMVMAVSPCLKWEMHINTKKTPNNFVESYALEEAEMSHIVELHKHSDNNKSIDKPSQI